MASVTYEHVYKRFGDVVAVNDLTSRLPTRNSLSSSARPAAARPPACACSPAWKRSPTAKSCIGDRVVNDVPPKDRDIAMVFQSYALYPHMSVYDNMAFGLKLRKTPKAEIDKKVKEAADILGIGQLLDRKPKQLSGGQRQRVAVGRAIVREPAVFLFDEPLSNLDAKLRVQTRAEISKLHQRLGTTFIYVTHDQVEAMTMGTPHRGHEGWPAAADRHAAEPVRPSGQRVRGRLHRQPVHELLRCDPGGAGRQAVRGQRHVQGAGAGQPARRSTLRARARRSSSASGPKTSTPPSTLRPASPRPR